MFMREVTRQETETEKERGQVREIKAKNGTKIWVDTLQWLFCSL